MKNPIYSVLVFMFAVIACVIALHTGGLTAHAVNDLSIVTTELSEDESEYAKKGDFKAEVWIANNTGYTGYGGAVYYDKDNYSVVMDEDGNVVNAGVYNGSAIVMENNIAKSMVAISLASATPIRGDQPIAAFYLRPIGTEVSTDPITDFTSDDLVGKVDDQNASIPYTEPEEYEYTYIQYEYIVGDVNGDGVIDSVDSVIVSQVVEANGGSISAEDFSENTPFIEYDDVVCIGVVDADGDNDIDADDSREILIYYRNTSIMGTPYEGLVGTTGYYYITMVNTL